MSIWGVTWHSGMMPTTGLLWTRYGHLTRALLGADLYLFGVAHHFGAPQWCPWVCLGDWDLGPHCPWQSEMPRPVEAWSVARIRRAVDIYEATHDLVTRWPAWDGRVEA